MATTVDTLLVRIEADMTDLKRSLDKVQRDVDKSSKGIGAAFRNVGLAIKATLAAVVVQQAGRAGAAIIGLASDIEEMQGKSKVVFGQFRDQVVDDLEEFGNTVGRATHELEGMAASIQDTFVPMGFARGEAAKLSVELTKLAVDVASFNNASDVETMEAFQSALVGNHETVRRFGVVITEATLNQELFRMGIAKGTKEATNAEKVQARLNLIIRGTSDAHGDAARTADSFANRSRALRAQLSELAGELGTILLPAVTDIVEALLEGVRASRGFLEAIGVLSKYEAGLEGTKAQAAALRAEINALANEQGLDASMEQLGNSEIANKQRLLRTLEDQIATQENELSMSNREAAFNRKPVRFVAPDVPFGFEADKANKAIMKMLEANMHATRELELERALTEARKLNNKSKIQAAELAISKYSADKQLMDVTEEMLEKEYNLTRVQYAGLNVKDALALKSAALAAALEKEGVSQAAATKAVDDYIKKQQELEELKPMYDAQLSAVQSMSQGISNAFSDMLTSGKFNMDSLKDVFRSFVKTMIAKAIELFIVNKILGSLFGLPTTTFSSGATVLGKVATGGAVNANQPYLVGERGPELIVPNSASTVMNSNNTRSALGGGDSTTIVQNINISTGVQQTVRSEIRSLMPEIADSAKAAVADSKRRGGSYGRAFA